MSGLKQEGKYLLFVVVATVWIAGMVILPDFVDDPVHNFRSILTIGGYVIATSGLSFLLLYLAGLNPYVATLFYPFYGVVGAAISYYRMGFKVTLTPIILNCVFKATPTEVEGVVSWSAIGWVALSLGISIGLVIWRWHLQTPRHAWAHALTVALLFVAYYWGNGRLHSSLGRRFPMVLVQSLEGYWQMQQQKGQVRTVPAYECEQAIDSLNIVVVIGESQRADHWQLNGYARETMPRMSQKQAQLVSFPHIYSQYTYTDASVPVIVTRADSLHPEYQYSECAFPTILQQQGYHTAWLSNGQIDEDYLCFGMACDTVIWRNAGKTPTVFDGFYDEVLLGDLQAQLNDQSPRHLVVMHCIGSHWYYNSHVSEAFYYFEPITNERVVTYNEPQQIINSYDNTVRYLDFVLDSITQTLQKSCSVMLYLSDHGEALGENGAWLHANGMEVVKNPACLIWYSPLFAERYPDKVAALKSHQAERYLTDFFFHTVLGAAGITVTAGDTTANQRLNLWKE